MPVDTDGKVGEQKLIDRAANNCIACCNDESIQNAGQHPLPVLGGCLLLGESLIARNPSHSAEVL